MKEYHLAPSFDLHWNRLNCLHPDHHPSPEKHEHLERMMSNHWMGKNTSSTFRAFLPMSCMQIKCFMDGNREIVKEDLNY